MTFNPRPQTLLRTSSYPVPGTQSQWSSRVPYEPPMRGSLSETPNRNSLSGAFAPLDGDESTLGLLNQLASHSPFEQNMGYHSPTGMLSSPPRALSA